MTGTKSFDNIERLSNNSPDRTEREKTETKVTKSSLRASSLGHLSYSLTLKKTESEFFILANQSKKVIEEIENSFGIGKFSSTWQKTERTFLTVTLKKT